MPSTLTVETATCTRCGVCVAECPTGAIVISKDGTPTVNEDFCIDCGHCGAACSVNAFRSTIGDFPVWQDPGISPSSAKAFLIGRRSVRRYRSTTISKETLDEVLSVGPYAPTASNAQDVQATVLTGDRVFEFATLVNDYYRWFAGLLERRILWPLLWFTAARSYLRNPRKVENVRQHIKDFDRGRDWIFFGAPVVVVLSAPRKNKLFGRINCVIAAERIMQYASTLGLGTCWIGYADIALRNRPSIERDLGIPKENKPLVIFTLGVPTVAYHRLPARRLMKVTYSPR